MTVSPSRRRLNALVTRPRAEAGELAAALARRGIDALIEPLIDIRYRDATAPDLVGVRAVLFTSANGVRALARLTSERNVPVFAVGEATAARARAEGFTAVESAGGNAADLARLVRTRLAPEGGRLLHVAGTEVAGNLAGALAAAGFAVEQAALYEAAAAAALGAPTQAGLVAGTVDLALFFSPRTAAIFTRLVVAAGLVDALAEVTAVSISAAADAALHRLRFRRREVAAAPTQAAVLAAIDGLLVDSGGEAPR
jgi:uroporphyrinogen-III synthase